MANPTQIIIPGADFTANPPFWSLPTSVAPAYVGIFGSTMARSLANGAAFGLAPSTISGLAPTIAPAYMGVQGWDTASGKQQGILLGGGVLTGTAYSILMVAQTPGAFSGFLGPIFGTYQSGASGPDISFFSATQVQFRQKTVTNYTSCTFGIGASSTWQCLMAQGAQGVGTDAYTLTGGSSAHVANADTTAFTVNTAPIAIGGGRGTTAGNSPAISGPTNIAIVVVWQSSLSAQDRAAAYLWAQALCAKNGITI